MGKRTYSQRAKRCAAASHSNSQDPRYSRKRLKTNNDLNDPSSLPSPPPSRGEKKSAPSKKSSHMFRGPVSIPDEETEGQATSDSKGKGVSRAFDKALSGKLKPSLLKHNHNIYGSMEDFTSTMTHKRKSGLGNALINNGALPSPPAEYPKVSHQNAGPVSTRTSRLFEKVIKDQPPKQVTLPEPRPTEVLVAPRRTIMGGRLGKQSKEALLWMENQKDSPLLRLPGEIRNRIYEYALGGNTIMIDFETYRTTYIKDEPSTVAPVFKYHCTVYDEYLIPFRREQPNSVNISSGFELLTGVCRQMYLETDTLPFKHNLVCFGSHNIMFNMLFLEKKLSRRQLDAISEMILPDALPQPNMLASLRNLKRVMLARIVPSSKPPGYHFLRTGDWYLVNR